MKAIPAEVYEGFPMCHAPDGTECIYFRTRSCPDVGTEEAKQCSEGKIITEE